MTPLAIVCLICPAVSLACTALIVYLCHIAPDMPDADGEYLS